MPAGARHDRHTAFHLVTGYTLHIDKLHRYRDDIVCAIIMTGKTDETNMESTLLSKAYLRPFQNLSYAERDFEY
jgi:hypothetical protein